MYLNYPFKLCDAKNSIDLLLNSVYVFKLILLLKTYLSGQWKILKRETAIPSQNLPKIKLKKAPLVRRVLRRDVQKNLATVKEVSQEPNVEDLKTEEDEASNNEEDEQREDLRDKKEKAVQTIISFSDNQLIAYSQVSDKQLKHLTGLSRKLFTFISNEVQYTKVHPRLSREEELMMVFMKYRLNIFNSTLSCLFDIDIRTVGKIIGGWTHHLYKYLKQIDLWKIRLVKEGEYSVILDCTEFKTERSGHLIKQQATYSNYYRTNTFKVLVGCTESGMVCFVSDAFGGCITDRKITELSGIVDLLNANDYVLADRGFDISDILEKNGVFLSIPPFKRSRQLTENEVAETRALANRRIIVENVIGLAKKYKILSDRVPTSLWPLFNDIVYICFVLVNFKKSIK